MAFDSAVMAAVVDELSRTLTGGRISKIYQPEPDEIALQLYAGGANHRLLISANARFARLQLTKLGAMLTELSEEQAQYIGVAKEGP
ncbi:MAG TPA: adenosylhomocysteinase, partial [Symbiobacteriaceae bacterium]|nr:adenosylhomocysteinase [Symbiobacteriaceae bacterium]